MVQVVVLAASLLVTLAALRSAPAQAVSIGEGMLQAMSYRTMPEGPAVLVTSYDDAALGLLIRDHMTETLRTAGCNVSAADARLELALSSQIRSVVYEGRDPSLGKLSIGGFDFKVQANIWSSMQDSILGGRKNGIGRQGANEFEIEATLRDRSAGSVVWQGRAVVPQLGNRLEAMVPDMVEALAANLGRTVRGETFPIHDRRTARTAAQSPPPTRARAPEIPGSPCLSALALSPPAPSSGLPGR